MKISGDGSKAEDYEAIAPWIMKIPRVTTKAFYQQLDANQLEVQAILGQDFEGLATIKVAIVQKGKHKNPGH